MEFDNVDKEFSGHAKVLKRLKDMLVRFNEINKILEDPETYSNHKHAETLNKERSELDKPAKLFFEYTNLIDEITDAKNMIELEKDVEMRQLAKDDLELSLSKKIKLEKDLVDLLTKTDPNDARDIFLEIRAGTGGDEAAIFCGDLFRMYSKYFEKNSWTVEVINVTEADHGGYREIITKILGNNVYGDMKFESGTHRVQRVPNTETQGRIHTSAATIAILPVIKTIDEIEINPSDLSIVEVGAAQGAGDPRDWNLLGSNNGTDWTTVDSRSGIDFPQRKQRLEFSVTNPGEYEYYRFDASNNSGNTLQFGELELFTRADIVNQLPKLT